LKREFKYEESTKIVLNTFGSFSQTFEEIAERFVKNGWIDVYPKEGKTSGAFSHGCSHDVHPYVLLNHFGTIRDVFTLAHELGHGIHQTLSSRNGPILSDTPITLSEVASLFAENMLFEKMFETASNDLEQIDLLCSRLDDSINSVVRQIAFFKFERKVHELRRAGELSFAEISGVFLEMQNECLGEYVHVDECISCYWCYISHFFHTPFYVYAYAFGDMFVKALYKSYRTDASMFVEKYMNMLSRGGIDKYDVAASNFGLNTMELKFWEDGVSSIADQVKYLETLCDHSVFN
jgi:oligoendopeptidase F